MSSHYSFQTITQFNLQRSVCWFWSSGAGVIILATAGTMWPKLSGFVARHGINLSVPRLELDSEKRQSISWVLLSRIIIGQSVYSINIMIRLFPETFNPCLSLGLIFLWYFVLLKKGIVHIKMTVHSLPLMLFQIRISLFCANVRQNVRADDGLYCKAQQMMFLTDLSKSNEMFVCETEPNWSLTRQ